MFRQLTSKVQPKAATVLKQQQRFWHDANTPRTWVQRYDRAITDKYPRVLDVIQGRLSRTALNTTERTAHFVATYRTGVSGSKRTRQRERRANFTQKVDALVKSWRDVEVLQRKANTRNSVLAKGSHNKLSTWKTKINEAPHQMEFTLTTGEVPASTEIFHTQFAPVFGTKQTVAEATAQLAAQKAATAAKRAAATAAV